MEIIPNVHLIPKTVANPYLLIDPDGLTLIDAGLPGSHKKILRYMAGLGYAPGDLKRILITHADYDHVGGLARSKKATGARVYASPVEAQGHGGRTSLTPGQAPQNDYPAAFRPDGRPVQACPHPGG